MFTYILCAIVFGAVRARERAARHDRARCGRAEDGANLPRSDDVLATQLAES